MSVHQFSAGENVTQRQSESENPPLTVFVGAKSPLYWRPLVDAYAGGFERGADDPDQGFYDLIEAYTSHVDGADATVRAAALVECMSAHACRQVKEQAMEFIVAGLAADGNTAFRVTRNLVEDDDMAVETLKNIAVSAEEISLLAMEKVMAALSTRWYERVQGYIEEYTQIAGQPPQNLDRYKDKNAV